MEGVLLPPPLEIREWFAVLPDNVVVAGPADQQHHRHYRGHGDLGGRDERAILATRRGARRGMADNAIHPLDKPNAFTRNVIVTLFEG